MEKIRVRAARGRVGRPKPSSHMGLPLVVLYVIGSLSATAFIIHCDD
jgi:hypothetical protein